MLAWAGCLPQHPSPKHKLNSNYSFKLILGLPCCQAKVGAPTLESGGAGRGGASQGYERLGQQAVVCCAGSWRAAGGKA